MSVRLSVRVKPRASRTRLLKAEALELVVALAAPPVDGAANEELLAFLATLLGCAKSALRLVVGQTSKQKVVEVSGMDAAEAAKRIAAASTATR
jgi:uncharacterized protein (TIGR00251 family)